MEYLQNLKVKRTKPHEQYLTPYQEQIKDKLNDMNFKGDFNMSIAQDLCNVMSYEFFEEDPEKAFIKPSTWNLSPDRVKYHENIQEFLRKIDYNKYPGTPLERACMVVKHLNAINEQSSQGQGKGKGGANGKGEDENGEQELQMFTPGAGRSTPDEIAEQMVSQVEKLRHMSDFEKEALELNNKNHFEQIVDLAKYHKEFTKISLKLKTFGRITVKAKRTKIKDPYSRKKRYMQINDVSKAYKVPKSSMLDPSFEYKLISKQLMYKEGYQVEAEKQILMMLLDDSGSMSTPQKIAWRNAVLLNRCEAVAKGEAELIFYRYETDRYGRTHVKTKEEAMALFNNIKKHIPGGGGTNIEGVLRDSIEEISKMNGYKPDIIIVMDGQDHFTDMDNKGTIVHSIIIGSEHKHMEKFCKKTGGLIIAEKEAH